MQVETVFVPQHVAARITRGNVDFVFKVARLFAKYAGESGWITAELYSADPYTLAPPRVVGDLKCLIDGLTDDTWHVVVCLKESAASPIAAPPAAPAVQKTPAALAVQKTPAAPALQKTPAALPLQKTPAALALQKTPSALAAKKNPSALAAKKNPSAPAVRKNPAAPAVPKNPSAPAVPKNPAVREANQGAPPSPLLDFPAQSGAGGVFTVESAAKAVSAAARNSGKRRAVEDVPRVQPVKKVGPSSGINRITPTCGSCQKHLSFPSKGTIVIRAPAGCTTKCRAPGCIDDAVYLSTSNKVVIRPRTPADAYIMMQPVSTKPTGTQEAGVDVYEVVVAIGGDKAYGTNAIIRTDKVTSDILMRTNKAVRCRHPLHKIQACAMFVNDMEIAANQGVVNAMQMRDCSPVFNRETTINSIKDAMKLKHAQCMLAKTKYAATKRATFKSKTDACIGAVPVCKACRRCLKTHPAAFFRDFIDGQLGEHYMCVSCGSDTSSFGLPLVDFIVCARHGAISSHRARRVHGNRCVEFDTASPGVCCVDECAEPGWYGRKLVAQTDTARVFLTELVGAIGTPARDKECTMQFKYAGAAGDSLLALDVLSSCEQQIRRAFGRGRQLAVELDATDLRAKGTGVRRVRKVERAGAAASDSEDLTSAAEGLADGVDATAHPEPETSSSSDQDSDGSDEDLGGAAQTDDSE